MPDDRTTPIALDTLGKLRARGNGLWGSCLDCAALYRKDLPAEMQISSSFDINLDRLIAERGADSTCIRMAPVPCPRCGGRRTEYRISVPGERGYSAVT
jgi:hypothetical protein